VSGRLVREPGATVAPDVFVAWDVNRKALPRARISLAVLYQDEHLLVVDKPAGLLSVPTAPGLDEDTALARVQEYARHLSRRRPYVGLVHRLDRDTSGALAFALSGGARPGLIALFRDHRIERSYTAIVEGRPPAETGVVDAPITEAYAGGRRRIARAPEPSLPAVTRFTVRERFERAALLEVHLETGRQHQIRLHLAHAGLPVLGDPVYRPRGQGAPPIVAARQMLHAHLLAFCHPITGQLVRALAPRPKDFEAALVALRRRRPPIVRSRR
jgi:23S rRNA pseudouridine1911/1915/1917 synthase